MGHIVDLLIATNCGNIVRKESDRSSWSLAITRYIQLLKIFDEYCPDGHLRDTDVLLIKPQSSCEDVEERLDSSYGLSKVCANTTRSA